MRCSRRGYFGLWLVADFPANIWPKLFHHDRNRVVSDLRAPHAGGIRQCPIGVRVVAVRGDPLSASPSRDGFDLRINLFVSPHGSELLLASAKLSSGKNMAHQDTRGLRLRLTSVALSFDVSRRENLQSHCRPSAGIMFADPVPACVVGALPWRASFGVRSRIFFSGIWNSTICRAVSPNRRPLYASSMTALHEQPCLPTLLREGLVNNSAGLTHHHLLKLLTAGMLEDDLKHPFPVHDRNRSEGHPASNVHADSDGRKHVLTS
jgi:hypothetical protein